MIKRKRPWATVAVLAIFGSAVIALWVSETDPVAMRGKYGSSASHDVDVGGGLTIHVRDEGPRDRRSYPGVGHVMMEEIPAQSARDRSKWLASLPAPR